MPRLLLSLPSDQSKRLSPEDFEDVMGMKREVERQAGPEMDLDVTARAATRGTGPKPGKVLVVDDEIAICDLFSLYLGWKGLEVKAAKSPGEAVARACETEYDLVILDWDLAGVEALDLLNFFKGTWPHIPVIIYTGQAIDEPFLKKALGGRADAILRKLGSLDEFWREVRRQLAKREAQACWPSGIREIQ